jgi:AraC family transcriptional regulator
VADLPNLANLDYLDRVNRAVDYVTQDLARPLRLEDVARAACFSPYHFHRIFHVVMGETLAAFVKRVRLERAVFLLSHRPATTLTEIALSCGFSSSSDFSRAFRAHYGVSPRRFDVAGVRRSGREAMRVSPVSADQQNPDGFVVTVRNGPARRVAYIRVQRPYEGDHVTQAVARLLAWAEARGLADGQWLGYQWDDPEIVPLEKIRYDIGIEVPGATAADGEVSVTTFESSLVAEIEIAGTADVEVRALDWLFRGWLPSSGYAPAHQPMFEAFNGRPFAHGHEHFELRVQLPVVDERLPL